MPQPGSRRTGFFQSSQATFLELWASPDLLKAPWTILNTSLGLGKLEITFYVADIVENVADIVENIDFLVFGRKLGDTPTIG